LGAFVPFALVGRVPWVSAYLGLGYCSSEHVEAAEEFLGSLGGLLGFLVILAGLVYLVWTRRGRRAAGPGGTTAGGTAVSVEGARGVSGGAAEATP
jgi:membrane protein DedA with SNARE-associated domain